MSGEQEAAVLRRGTRAGAWLSRRAVAGALLVLAIVAFLVSNARNGLRCHEECYGDPPLDRYGSLTYEPGHPWTHYANSWQWEVQHDLTLLALMAAFVALGLALWSRRSPLIASGVSAGALATWLTWVLLSPPIP